MALSEQAAREILQIVRKHVDSATLKKIFDELQEVRGDKDFRDAVTLLVRISRPGMIRTAKPSGREG
jgi:hypothetical protein